jgi:hypothetical protein
MVGMAGVRDAENPVSVNEKRPAIERMILDLTSACSSLDACSGRVGNGGFLVAVLRSDLNLVSSVFFTERLRGPHGPRWFFGRRFRIFQDDPRHRGVG